MLLSDPSTLRRNLMLVTKVLQNISNGIRFGAKEQVSSILPSVSSVCALSRFYVWHSIWILLNCCLRPYCFSTVLICAFLVSNAVHDPAERVYGPDDSKGAAIPRNDSGKFLAW